MRRNNWKTKSSKAIGLAEKSEIETLFLDCIDEYKSQLLKRKPIAGNSSAKFTNNFILEKTTFESPEILEQIAMNKDTLISVFDEIFGSNDYIGI